MSTTCDRRSDPGLSSTGFIAASGATPHASAWSHCARPISDPSAQTIELLDMFWALKGATETPWRASQRHSPAVTRLLPASEVVPATSSPLATTAPHSRHTDSHSDRHPDRQSSAPKPTACDSRTDRGKSAARTDRPSPRGPRSSRTPS